MDQYHISGPNHGADPLHRLIFPNKLACIIIILAGLSLSCNFLALVLGKPANFPGALTEEQFKRLEISIGKSGQAQPGDRLELQIGTTECCYVFVPLAVKTEWSIEPQTGATINAQTGVLDIAKDTPSGSTIIVTADIENGRKILNAQVTVYTPKANPLVGVWHEAKQIDCQSQATTELQGESLRELVFKADGTFQATFTPFEVYHDYWGQYTFDPETSTIELVVKSGNFIPEKLDLQGKYAIDENGALVLTDIWLGRREQDSIAGCGHVFTK
jgi:hypothetical protein